LEEDAGTVRGAAAGDVVLAGAGGPEGTVVVNFGEVAEGDEALAGAEKVTTSAGADFEIAGEGEEVASLD
jgi:hypothetical protein